MNNIISQDFWCVTLDKDNRECVWKHDDEEISHHLMIEQVVLGLNCKERCMVEATSRLTSGEERSTMICQLIPSAVPNCKLSLSFKQVKLKLASGDGPVYLTGTHSQEIEEDVDSDDEEDGVPQLVENMAEEGEEDEEEEDSSDEEDEEVDEDKMLEELAAAQANKLKTFMKKDKKAIASTKPGPASKKEPKPEAKVEEAKEDTPAKEDEEMEEAPAEPEAVAEKKEPVKEAAEKKDEPMEEISTPGVEDDEESDDEEEEDDDEEGDEEESEEESEEEAAPVTKKRKTDAPAPVAVKNGKPAATPKQNKKPQTPSKPNLNDLKKKLLASPSLPKKYEKFVNLMKNAHKVTDEKEIKTAWEFVQKNKK